MSNGMHATAVFDGERWGTVLYLFLFALAVSAFYGWSGIGVSLLVGYDHDDIVRRLTLLLLFLLFSFFFWNDTYIS